MTEYLVADLWSRERLESVVVIVMLRLDQPVHAGDQLVLQLISSRCFVLLALHGDQLVLQLVCYSYIYFAKGFGEMVWRQRLPWCLGSNARPRPFLAGAGALAFWHSDSPSLLGRPGSFAALDFCLRCSGDRLGRPALAFGFAFAAQATWVLDLLPLPLGRPGSLAALELFWLGRAGSRWRTIC